MALPGYEELRELLSWEPEHGVLSLYLAIDHGDRGGGWWISLSGELEGALESGDQAGRELRLATKAAVDRVRDRFADRERPPDGRGLVGFVEIARKDGAERWYLSPATPRRPALARIGPRPHIEPLVAMLDDNRRRGAVVVSGERARLFEWEEATVTELGESEILTTGDWRERKGQRNFNVPAAQATSSSGRDLHEQRLSEHRHGFIRQVASEVSTAASDRGWEGVVCFGEAEHLAGLEAALGNGTVLHAERKNLLGEPTSSVAKRLEEIKEEMNRHREARLLEAAESAALSGNNGALGLVEVAQSLAMGRVAHLLIAPPSLPERSGEELVEALALLGRPSTLPTAELLIERAIQTDALVTPVEGEAAARLAEREGAAAILRY